MKLNRAVFVFGLFFGSLGLVIGQNEDKLTVTKLNNGLYKFTIGADPYSTNMIASVGKDGVLLVDTGYKSYEKSLKEELQILGDSLPKMIINTHLHIDHTGNNDSFENDPIIIAHANVHRDMHEGRYMLRGLTAQSKPDIVIDKATSVFFNGEEIKIIPVPGSHSDGDVVVYFTKSKVMVTGDIGYGGKYPSYDLYNGNVSLYAKSVNEILQIAEDNITYISGHGKDLNREDMLASYRMLSATTEIVKIEMLAGKALSEIQNEQKFPQWSSFEEGYTSRETWIKDLFQSIQFPDRIPSLIPMLDKAYTDKGIDETIKKFHEVKGAITKEGIIISNLQAYATILYNRDDIHAAILLLKVLTNDYSHHSRIWVNYANLGNCYMKVGEFELAREYLKKSFDINPTDYVSSRLEELKNK